MKFRKTLLFLLALSVFTGALCASAAEITVTNTLSHRVSLVFAYTDSETGDFITTGWRRVDPGSSISVSLPADEAKGIYYGAYNKNMYIDSSTRSSEIMKCWMSSHNFTFSGLGTPDTDDVWQGRVFLINGSSVRINAQG